MKAGIIAAGLGERLRRGGIATPKPLLVVGGRTLLERAIASATVAGAEEVALIVNAESPEVESYVRGRDWPVPVNVTVKTTPSSMESFFTLAPALGDSPFLLLTVDALSPPGTLDKLAREGLAAGPTGALAVTDFVDDEKPLWVRIGEAGRIVALGQAAARSGWVTSGAYFFHPVVYEHVAEARRQRLGALREFLALLLEKSSPLWAVPVGKSVDVDRPEDLPVAEEFVKADG
ncbi:MAG: nucleotidyltransferase family protein [Candidatus Binatia bacterium]